MRRTCRQSSEGGNMVKGASRLPRGWSPASGRRCASSSASGGSKCPRAVRSRWRGGGRLIGRTCRPRIRPATASYDSAQPVPTAPPPTCSSKPITTPTAASNHITTCCRSPCGEVGCARAMSSRSPAAIGRPAAADGGRRPARSRRCTSCCWSIRRDNSVGPNCRAASLRRSWRAPPSGWSPSHRPTPWSINRSR
jgi:hypothetical protein